MELLKNTFSKKIKICKKQENLLENFKNIQFGQGFMKMNELNYSTNMC